MKDTKDRAQRFCGGRFWSDYDLYHGRGRFYALVFVILLCLTIIGCHNEGAEPRAQFEQDAGAAAQVRRIKALLAQVQRITPQDMAVLKELHAKYPDSSEVRQTLQSAMIVWKDWDGVAQLIASVPEAQRTRQDQITLAQVLLVVGRYHEASAVAGPLAEAAPSDLEANTLAGRAWYHEGQYDDAARAFDRVWNSLIAAQRAEDIMLRGLIYFYRNDHQKALETLKTALTLQPDYYPGYGALSRVYRAMGDTQQAEEYQRQGAAALARQTTERARLSRLSSGLRELELAWNEHRYEDVVRLTQDLLQKDANSPQRPVLYEYLAQAYQALGRTAEAQAAKAEAARARSNKPQQ